MKNAFANLFRRKRGGAASGRTSVILACALFLTAAAAHAENTVAESAFCLKMEGHECTVPAISEEIRLSDIQTPAYGVPYLYFWSKISVTEDKNIVHVWRTRDRKDKWAEPVHVSRSDRLRNLSLEIVNRVFEFMRIKYKSDDSLHSVQGVMLPLNKSPRFRTYSRVYARPGEYSVEVCDMNGDPVPGGEMKTIRVSP
jgi:hypothetical protein